MDRLLGTSFIVIVLFFVGALAGFTNIFKLVKADCSKKTYLGQDASYNLKKSIKENERRETDRSDNNPS